MEKEGKKRGHNGLSPIEMGKKETVNNGETKNK